MDERMGVPSSSSMNRIMHCVGSFQLERQLPDVRSNYVKRTARRGERIHDVAAGKIPIDTLSFSDRVCTERFMFEEARLVEKFNFEGSEQIREHRLYLKHKGRVYHSGKPDVIHKLGNRALVINYKTGFLQPIPIQENWQCKSEGVLAAFQYSLKQVVTALIHPNAPVGGDISQFYIMEYDEIVGDHAILQAACVGAVQKEVRRTPGPWCEFCKGCRHKACPEWLQMNQ